MLPRLTEVKVEAYVNWSTDYAFTRQAIPLPDVERVALERRIVTEQELQRWHEQLEKADAGGEFFGCASQMVAGRKA